MHPYVAEDFTDAEVAVLRRYFTNLEGPVFALVNLPEVVKGALFARYSRSSKSLRRLFLDEFVGDLDRGRMMSYREQSARSLGSHRRQANGLYRFYRDNELLQSRFGARYIGEMDRMFDTYRELLPELTEWLTAKYPKTPDDTDFVYRQAIRAKALDGLRGLLPASALSNLGIYASGQAYESLLLRMRAHPLPEVHEYAQLMLDELVKVIPSFLRRLDVPSVGSPG